MTFEPPVMARVWKDGRRVVDRRVLSVSTDGDTITLTARDETIEVGPDEWDELTVDHQLG